jgi:hypothetical protein
MPVEVAIVKRSLGAVILLAALSCAAQAPWGQVSIHAVLIDKDLNQKPVPRLNLVFTRVDSAPPQETIVKTGFDGHTEAKLPPGKIPSCHS